MTPPPPETGEDPARRELYRRLAALAPAERARTVLSLIRDHPQGRLELPAVDGLSATLNEIDLTVEGAQPLDLKRSDIRGASLRLAKLRGVVLEEANLAGTDLAGADLRGAVLSGADLRDAMLEEVDLRGATLRFADGRGAVLEGAKLQGADLWGVDLQGAVLAGADLQGAILTEADLRGADLRGADLRGVILKQANLEGANLEGADLQDATFGDVRLKGASLRNARLQGVVLTHAHIEHVHLSDAWLERTRLRLEQLGGAIGEELAGEYELARRGYLALERNFSEIGDPDAASWAYRRKRRMKKMDSWQRARRALAEDRRAAALDAYARYAGDQFVEWVCDYGESVPRVLASLLVVYVFFVLFYGVTGSVLHLRATPAGQLWQTTRDPLDLAVFSLLAMTTSGTPSVLVPRNEFVYLLTGLQALLGIAMTGLLGFVVGNRIRR